MVSSYLDAIAHLVLQISRNDAEEHHAVEGHADNARSAQHVLHVAVQILKPTQYQLVQLHLAALRTRLVHKNGIATHLASAYIELSGAQAQVAGACIQISRTHVQVPRAGTVEIALRGSVEERLGVVQLSRTCMLGRRWLVRVGSNKRIAEKYNRKVKWQNVRLFLLCNDR